MNPPGRHPGEAAGQQAGAGGAGPRKRGLWAKVPGLDRLPHWELAAKAYFFGGNQVSLLQGGDELFPAMLAAIRAAHHDIWVVTYIFEDDDEVIQLVHALTEAAARGVRVRVVVDGFGSRLAIPRLRDLFEPAGVVLAVFGPMDSWWRWLRSTSLWRLHQKLCVVDDAIAFVGGINLIADRLDPNHGWTDTPRLDFAVSVRGPVVRTVAATARAVWSRAFVGREFTSQVREVVRASAPVKAARRVLRRLRMPDVRRYARREADQSPMLAAFVRRDNFSQRRAIENIYIEAISHARHSVDLITPYFYPGSEFRKALKSASARGVKVRLLLQGKVDYRIARMAATALYDELLAAGVQIFEYTPAFLHAKVAVIDGHWATVGSSNIDPLSVMLNWEANVVVKDDAFASTLQSRFEQAIAQSRLVSLEHTSAGLWGMARRVLVAWCAHVYLKVAGLSGKY